MIQGVGKVSNISEEILPIPFLHFAEGSGAYPTKKSSNNNDIYTLLLILSFSESVPKYLFNLLVLNLL